MAYGKQFTGTYKSMNGWDYFLEIYVNGYTGSSSAISLGNGGCTIKYSTNTESRFNTILPSTMSIPFIVENASQETDFITKLRTTYEENDVYVHLYQSTSADERALWSGWILMDLSVTENIGYPYEVDLEATDGLALLKDMDFVKGSTTPPYEFADLYTYWNPIKSWIHKIINKLPVATTTEGTYADWQIRTSMNWYNGDSVAVSQANDPLVNTRIKPMQLNSESQDGEYEVSNCYTALEEILKVIGCRIVYWQHIYWIIQIDEYNTAESGTFAAPINNDTRSYDTAGVSVSDYAYLGTTTLARYELDIASGTGGIQLLKGSKFSFLPKVKRATAQFISAQKNYYGGFPVDVPSGGATTSVFQSTISDANTYSELFIEIPLSVVHTAWTFVPFTFEYYFDLYATDGVDTYYLRQTASTGTIVWDWNTTQPSYYPVGGHDPPKIECGQLANPLNPTTITGFSEIVPTASWMAGDWDFYIRIDAPTGTTNTSAFKFYNNIGFGSSSGSVPSGLSWGNIPNSNSGVITTTTQTVVGGILGTPSQIYTYGMSGGNPFNGSLIGLNSTSGVSAYGVKYIADAYGDNSYVYDFGILLWGDSVDGGASNGAMQVYTGSAWTMSDIAGKWGRSTLSGTSTISNLLLTEFIQGQAPVNLSDTNREVKVLNATLVISSQNKTETDGTATVPKYVNPIGRLSYDSLYYVFRRGTFQTSKDEWDYEGFQIFRNT